MCVYSVCVCVCVCESFLTLSNATRHQWAFSANGIFQARILEQFAISHPRGSS